MTTVAITGYASLDYVLRLEGAPRPNETVIGARAGLWPRLGGSPAYVARALTRAGIRATPITWVADDLDGTRYAAALACENVPTEGIARTLAGNTPACILAYGPAGECFCLYIPEAGRTAGLGDSQRNILRAAEWVCLTVGPAEANRAALAAIAPHQRLAWVVKGDADAFPPALRADLAARADLIVHSRGERAFVAEALAAASRPGRMLVETLGAEGASVTVDGVTALVAPEATVAAADPTGAGDPFVGGLLAALLAAPEDAAAAVRAGQRAAHDMLRARQEERIA